jgi:hypothetical protein
MTKWNQLGCALGGGDSRDSRDFKRIALGRLQAADAGNRRTLHANEGVSNGCARCGRLGGDVYHLHAASAVVVRKFCHWNLPILQIEFRTLLRTLAIFCS